MHPPPLSAPTGPSGTDLATKNPCPPGRFGQREYLTDFTECAACTPGFYCAGTALQAESGQCDPGYYCVGGSDTAQQHLCGQGKYCPRGSSGETLCPVGTYSAGTGLSDVSECTQCTAGYYCDRLGQTAPTDKCNPGYYCSSGAKRADPNGDGGNVCPRGYYCLRGTGTPILCPVAQYNNQTGQSACTTCPPGFECNHNDTTTPIPCKAGYFCPGLLSLRRKTRCL